MTTPVDGPVLRDLLFRARDSILLELRRQAYDRLPEPTRLLLEIDAALGIEDHTWYSDPGGMVADNGPTVATLDDLDAAERMGRA